MKTLKIIIVLNWTKTKPGVLTNVTDLWQNLWISSRSGKIFRNSEMGAGGRKIFMMKDNAIYT
jgi:hypothetical protein